MRVTYTRTGGFAAFPGLERPVTIDSQDLPPDERPRLDGLLRSLGPVTGTEAPPGAADLRTYTVEITDDSGGTRTLRFTDPVPEAAQPFVDYAEHYRRQRAAAGSEADSPRPDRGVEGP